MNRGGSRREPSITAAMLVAAVAALIGILLCPNPWAAHEEKASTLCTMQQTRLAMAMLMYADEHDDRLPSATSWTIGTLPYRNGDLWSFTCPMRSHAGELTYSMCPAVSRRDTAAPGFDAMHYLLLYEVRGGIPATPHRTYPASLWRYPSWLQGRRSPAPGDRSPDRYMWVTFVDGHRARRTALSPELLRTGYDPEPF